jgi:SAM-dependent MidA family methyltransferase
MPSWLAEVVQGKGGKIRFDQFMELALYDPTYGYYSARMQTVGRAGDFSTSATLDESLGRALSSWIRSEAEALRPARPTVIELGAGTGQLARAILRHFRLWDKLRYYVVDVRTWSQLPHRTRHFSLVSEALRAADGLAILFSNEFVDAFPCRRFIRTESGWDEIWLELQHGRWIERGMPIDAYPESHALSSTLPIGQRIEVHESYHSWLKDLSCMLERGSLLTIDYGGSTADIYRGQRSGTLRAFFQHQRLQGMEIYLRPGQQDLTADVNFEDLRSWGEGLGLGEITCISQREFIEAWYPDVLASNNQATRFIMDPAGAGTAFKVLHQRKYR